MSRGSLSGGAAIVSSTPLINELAGLRSSRHRYSRIPVSSAGAVHSTSASVWVVHWSGGWVADVSAGGVASLSHTAPIVFPSTATLPTASSPTTR